MNLVPIVTKDTPPLELLRIFWECSRALERDEHGFLTPGKVLELEQVARIMEEVNGEMKRRVLEAQALRESGDPGTKDDRASEDHSCA